MRNGKLVPTCGSTRLGDGAIRVLTSDIKISFIRLSLNAANYKASHRLWVRGDCIIFKLEVLIFFGL